MYPRRAPPIGFLSVHHRVGHVPEIGQRGLVAVAQFLMDSVGHRVGNNRHLESLLQQLAHVGLSA